MSILVLGTRGSALALTQARQVAAQLMAAHPGLKVEERIITTTGDVRSAASLPAIGGKGVFTLEIEAALLSGEIDFAVHSLKDLPPDMPDGLCLAAVPQRVSPVDVLIKNLKLKTQNPKFLVGTSSLRRRAMILSLHPNWETTAIRGNVGTRLEKIESQNMNATILARAGLHRLELEGLLEEQIVELDPQTFIPAPGQGALGIQARGNDEHTLRLLDALEHAPSRAEIVAERAIVRALSAGCSTPLGALARAEDGVLSLRACVLSPDGDKRIDAQGIGIPERAAELGNSVAQKLIDQGAQEMLT